MWVRLRVSADEYVDTDAVHPIRKSSLFTHCYKEEIMWKWMLFTLFLISLLIYPLSAQNNFSLSLDVDGSAGDQAVTSVNTSADQDVSVQVFGSAIQNANAFGLRFEYDASQVTYQGFDAGNVLSGTPQILPQHGTNPTYVEIGIASLGSQATVSSGLIGTIRFRTTTAFSGTAIRLVQGQLSRGRQSETLLLNVRVELQVSAASPSSDFDGDGTIGISDFLLFVNHFGLNRGDAGYDAKYDLDSNNGIGISDFMIFVNNFGSQVPASGGGSGGSGGSGGTSPSVRLIRLTQNYGDVEYLAYSPDGSKIAFVSERGDNNDAIYVMNADGSNPIRLTQNYDDVEYLVYSPDGSRIAFVSERGNNDAIYVMNADGSNPIRLTQNYDDVEYLAYSPDGSRIAFVSERGNNDAIYVMNADGSNPIRLTQNYGDVEYLAYSPDGSQIAFVSERGDNDVIYVMNADGSNPIRLTQNYDDIEYLAWSSDGSEVVIFLDYDDDDRDDDDDKDDDDD